MTELTLGILDEAIKQLESVDYQNEIVGFRLNPSDLRNIKEGTKVLCAAEKNRLFMCPPYKGVFLVADASRPVGLPEAILRRHKETVK